MKTNLKSNILVAVIGILTTLLPQMATAQTKGFHYGIRFGLGESRVNLKGVSGEHTKLAFVGGIATTYQLNRRIGLTADFLFTSKGGEMKGVSSESGLFGSTNYSYEDQYSLYFAELPLAAKLSLPLGDDFAIKGFAGPSVNFNLLSLQTRVYDDPNYQSEHGYYDRELTEMNTLEYTWVYGVGVDIMGKDGRTFFLDYRRSEPATELGYINNRQAYSRYSAITAGYLF